MEKDILNEIFVSFDANTKQEWEEKATKDLKGKELSSLNWEISPEIQHAAYYTASDLEQTDHSILKTNNPDWQIGQDYVVDDYEQTNTDLLKDLMNGLNAPVFTFKNAPSLADLELLFKSVGLEHIDTYFASDEEALKKTWKELVTKRQINASVYFLSNSIAQITSKNIHIDGTKYYAGKVNVHQELAKTLKEAKDILKQSEDKTLAAEQIIFSFYVDTSYLLNVAKLRAFKLLWVQELQNQGLEAKLPFVKVLFAPEAYGEDEQDNLINATSMSMSAVIGGANHLTVRPTSASAQAKRLARNVQLILKHESGFNEIADPAFGSYYVESLTSKLVNFVE